MYLNVVVYQEKSDGKAIEGYDIIIIIIPTTHLFI